MKKEICSCSTCEAKSFSEDKYFPSAIVVFVTILLSALMLIASCVMSKPAHASRFSDEEIVNAIYKAEGGKNAKFLFGIKSIKCSGYSECRQICRTTIKRNRSRFAKYGYKNYPNFISFLGSRYCPTSGSLSASEKSLNGSWIKNVNYFLRKG